MANNIGPKIAIDGEAEFRRQIQRINDQAKELASEMKAVTASFTKNTTAQERAAATSAALTKQIQTQKDRIAALNNYYSEGQKKLSDLEKAMQDAVKAHGEDSKEAIRAAKAYDDEAAALSKYKVQINNATAELGKMENELAESADASDDLGDSLEDAGGSAFSFGDALKANVLSQAIVDGVRKLAEGFKRIAETAISYNADIEKYTVALATALGDETKAAETLAKIREDAARTPYSVDALVQANQLLISSTRNAEGSRETILALTDAISATGGGNDELLRMAQNLQQISNAGKATAEDIKQFAMAGIDIYGILSDYTGKSVEECQELEVSYELLNEALIAASQEGGRYFGANEAQAQTLNGKLSTLKDNIKDGLGTALAGMNDTLKGLIDRALEFIGSIDWSAVGESVSNALGSVQRYFEGIIDAVDWNAFGDIVASAFGLVKDAFIGVVQAVDWNAFREMIAGFIDFVRENGSFIIALIGGISTGFAAWNFLSTINGVVEAIKAFKTANEAATTAQAILNTVMNASPFALIASLVAAVVGAIVTLLLTNEDFRNSCIEAWEAIKEMAADLVNSIVVFFTETVPDAFWALVGVLDQWGAAVALFFTETILGILNAFGAFLSGVFAADWSNVFGPVLGGILNGFFHTVSDLWDAVKRVFSGVLEFVKGVFTGDWSRAWQGIVDIFGGIFDGIKAAAKAPLNALIGLLNGAIGAINRLIAGFNGIGFTMPKWLGGGTWHPNIPSIPSIPYLAEGGMVRSGYAIVGEAGPELLHVGPNGTRVQPLTPGERARGAGLGGITINVYGAEGQDVNVLADIVSRRLETKVQQIAGAWV